MPTATHEGDSFLIICQQGSHHGHDGKVCEQGRPKNLTRRIFHNTQMASPGSPNWTPKRGFLVQCRETREHTLVRAPDSCIEGFCKKGKGTPEKRGKKENRDEGEITLASFYSTALL